MKNSRPLYSNILPCAFFHIKHLKKSTILVSYAVKPVIKENGINNSLEQLRRRVNI
eukprot:Gb_01334 [translate_table: standard]